MTRTYDTGEPLHLWHPNRAEINRLAGPQREFDLMTTGIVGSSQRTPDQVITEVRDGILVEHVRAAGMVPTIFSALVCAWIPPDWALRIDDWRAAKPLIITANAHWPN